MALVRRDGSLDDSFNAPTTIFIYVHSIKPVLIYVAGDP